jgi:hypothetical protein
MILERLAAAAVIAVGLGMSAPTSVLGVVHAAPPAHSPAQAFDPEPGVPPPGIPAEKCWRYGRSGGGSPRGGGGMPGYLPQCPLHTGAPTPPA